MAVRVPSSWRRTPEGVAVRLSYADGTQRVVACGRGRARWSLLDPSAAKWELLDAQGVVLRECVPEPPGPASPASGPAATSETEVELPRAVAAAIVALREAQNDVLDRFAALVGPLVQGYAALVRVSASVPQPSPDGPAKVAEDAADDTLATILRYVGPDLVRAIFMRQAQGGGAGNGSATTSTEASPGGGDG